MFSTTRPYLYTRNALRHSMKLLGPCISLVTQAPVSGENTFAWNFKVRWSRPPYGRSMPKSAYGATSKATLARSAASCSAVISSSGCASMPEWCLRYTSASFRTDAGCRGLTSVSSPWSRTEEILTRPPTATTSSRALTLPL